MHIYRLLYLCILLRQLCSVLQGLQGTASTGPKVGAGRLHQIVMRTEHSGLACDGISCSGRSVSVPEGYDVAGS